VEAIHKKDEQSIEQATDAIKAYQRQEGAVRDNVKSVIAKAIPNAKTQDRDYIFLNFVLSHLPHGIIGLLLAVMFCAAMSSMAGELNALASTTSVDIYQRSFRPQASNAHYLLMSRVFTILWALIGMVFAMLASFAENLIQFVNIVGSLFYGTMLGIFLAAFYVRYVKGTAVFWAALVAEGIVLYCYAFTDIAYLLFNIVGCVSVIVLALVFQVLLPGNKETVDGP
jgi:Na+/proline symporter